MKRRINGGFMTFKGTEIEQHTLQNYSTIREDLMANYGLSNRGVDEHLGVMGIFKEGDR